jgi:hypothetical protein
MKINITRNTSNYIPKKSKIIDKQRIIVFLNKNLILDEMYLKLTITFARVKHHRSSSD